MKNGSTPSNGISRRRSWTPRGSRRNTTPASSPTGCAIIPLALPRYELALAIQPDSVDARYNFALALKAAGYAPDAADEFKKILAAIPTKSARIWRWRTSAPNRCTTPRRRGSIT